MRSGRSRDDLPGPFVEGRRREPVVEILRLARREPEAELAAFGREPEPLFGPVVVEMEVGLPGGDELALMKPKLRPSMPPQVEVITRPLPFGADGHAGPVAVGQFDELGVLGQEFADIAIGHGFAFRCRCGRDSAGGADGQRRGQDQGQTGHGGAFRNSEGVNRSGYSTTAAIPSPGAKRKRKTEKDGEA